MLDLFDGHWGLSIIVLIVFISVALWAYFFTGNKVIVMDVYKSPCHIPDTIIKLYIGKEGSFPSADPVNDEAITMTAVKLKNGTIYATPLPNTQEDIANAIHHNTLANVELIAEAGYITNYGQFVDEKWAYMLASSAFQTVEPTHFKTRLKPEDLLKRKAS